MIHHLPKALLLLLAGMVASCASNPYAATNRAHKKQVKACAQALRIIGYDTQDMGAAIRAFKLHFIQTDTTPVLTEQDKIVLYHLYKKYL